MRHSITLLGLLVISLNSWASITNTQNGVWSSMSTWGGGPVPTSSDDVIIASGTTVDVDINGAACNNLTVNGTLEYTSTDGRSLQANGDVLVNNTGTLQVSAAFSSGGASQSLTVSGNFTVDGIFTGLVAGSTSDSRDLIIAMYGDGKTIMGTGTLTIPDLRIFANTMLGYPVVGCSNLSLSSGNLDNSSNNITMPSDGAIYRYDGTISVAPNRAGNADVYYNNSSHLTTGPELPSSVYVLAVAYGGGITLDKSITVTGEADLTNGVVTTGSYSFTMGAGATLNSSQTNFVNGTLTMTYTGAGSNFFEVGSNTTRARDLYLTLSPLVFTGSNTSGTVTVKATEPNPAPGSNSSGASRISAVSYWTITAGPTISSFTAAVTLYWTSAGDGVTNPNTTTVVQGTAGGTWTVANNAGGESGSTTDGSVTGDGFTTFGDFALGSTASGDNPLPVELTSFTASVSNLTTTLVWNTATEVNNDGFEVQRGTANSNQLAGINWEKIGFVQGNGTSNIAHNYSYTDNAGTSGTYSYRLKQIDHNGAFTYSQEAQVTIEAPKVFTLAQNYPNPFNPTTTIQFTVPSDGRATLKVYNALGQEVATLFDGIATAGQYNQATFDASRLASGIYFSRLEFRGKMEMKKMLLLK